MPEKKPKIVLLFDYDRTLTEEYQQMPIVRDNFLNIQKAYDGKVAKFHILNPKGGNLEERIRGGGFGKIKGKIISTKEINENYEITELELGPIKMKKADHYFETSDIWSRPHNGFGYVQQLISDARKGIFENLTIERLFGYGKEVKLSKGAKGLIPALKDKWKDHCDIEAHIISVGIFEVIAGSEMASEFDGICATPLAALGEGNIINCAPDIVTPFNKSKHVIQIAKGGSEFLNMRMKSRDYAVDYRNIISFGDGLSDVSQFAYLRKKGADIICVYTAGDNAAFRRTCNNQILRERVNYLVPRDYRINSPTWNVINERIKRKLDRKCDLSPTIVDIYRKGRVGNEQIYNAVMQHIEECTECKTANSFNWIDTMKES